ncbi:hypothetical protein QAD02_008506 [Eretmocerus hayati]|uniref:Uncharacterized protein n=1 Tax=Eretmocerus hayati TaxID=131215 RepID=A0ACC2N942_9HYME|nr:hypothetical protein QAD02_008506 [Eretmocerus hayati]
MEWMKCNACWVTYESQQNHLEFFLTQCGHIYCAKCISKAEQRCIQCGTIDTISLPLKKPLNPQIQHYFQPIPEQLEKVRLAQQFQETQRSLCLQRGDACESKYQALKVEYYKAADAQKKLLDKYNRLKMAVMAMQQRGKVHHYTPSVLKTPVNQAEGRQHSSQLRFHDRQSHDNLRRNDGEFRVPTITRVPKSAGYYSASTSSSTSRMYSSTSDYSSTFSTPE